MHSIETYYFAKTFHVECWPPLLIHSLQSVVQNCNFLSKNSWPKILTCAALEENNLGRDVVTIVYLPRKLCYCSLIVNSNMKYSFHDKKLTWAYHFYYHVSFCCYWFSEGYPSIFGLQHFLFQFVHTEFFWLGHNFGHNQSFRQWRSPFKHLIRQRRLSLVPIPDKQAATCPSPTPLVQELFEDRVCNFTPSCFILSRSRSLFLKQSISACWVGCCVTSGRMMKQFIWII